MNAKTLVGTGLTGLKISVEITAGDVSDETQTCRELIANIDGYLEIVRLNPALGHHDDSCELLVEARNLLLRISGRSQS